jgi:hypothetical protein
LDKNAAAPDLSHLIPSMRTAAVLENPERLERIRADRWIGYPRAHEALRKLEALLTSPPRLRMPNLLIVGSTNNGKSMIIEKFRRAHLSNPSEEADHETIPIVVMQMPSEPTVARFYALLMAQLGAPFRLHVRVADIEHQALRILRAVGVRILVIDELHNMLVGRQSTQREFLNLIRFLGNELQIAIVGVGGREAYLAIRSDDQLENRFEPMVLPLWREDADYSSLLASFAAVLPLRRRSEIDRPEIARYVLQKSEGTIGEIATLLTRAAIAAIETGEEAITPSTLRLATYESPTERRRVFERELT